MNCFFFSLTLISENIATPPEDYNNGFSNPLFVSICFITLVLVRLNLEIKISIWSS